MRLIRITSLFLASFAFVGFFMPSGATALMNQKWQNCTAKDLNTTFGSSCMKQADQDILNGKPYRHVLFCGSGGALCCTVDENTGQVINCRKPAGSALSVQPSGQMRIAPRGVEGAESDELPEVPEWVTELSKEEQSRGDQGK